MMSKVAQNKEFHKCFEPEQLTKETLTALHTCFQPYAASFLNTTVIV